jgi:hypothetical protein
MTQSYNHNSSETVQLGFSANLFASRNTNEQTVVIGGLATDEHEWVRTLTRRAAIALWFDLTKLLFPEKSGQVISQVSTVPSMPAFNVENANITSWTFVSLLPDGGIEISGWVGKPGWSVRLNAYEVYRFWAALDAALYPTGW